MHKHPPLRPYSVGNKWLYVPIAKNAHRSIVDAIKASGKEWRKEYWNALPDLPRLVLMREPMDRAYSAYRMFVDDGTIDIDFSTFLLNADYTDMHMLPQWDSMRRELPNRIVRWDFEVLKDLLGLKDIPKIGTNLLKMGTSSVTVEAKAKFDSIYSEDIKLWYGAKQRS